MKWAVGGGMKMPTFFVVIDLSPAFAGLITRRILPGAYAPGFMPAPASQAQADFLCKATQRRKALPRF